MVGGIWCEIALIVFLSVFLALLAWLNHRHFDKFFDAMDGRFEGLVGGRSRRGGRVPLSEEPGYGCSRLVFCQLSLVCPQGDLSGGIWELRLASPEDAAGGGRTGAGQAG